MGVKEIVKEDGQREIIYYSVSTPAEREANVQKRQHEYQKSWEIPEKIIIDRRP